jgi:hypothetical protein
MFGWLLLPCESLDKYGEKIFKEILIHKCNKVSQIYHYTAL